MALWNRFARSRDEPRNIPRGRQTQVGNGYSTTLSPYTSRTSNVLEHLRRIPDEATAIEFLKKVNPDVSMATWNFVRLANQGNEIQFYSPGKSRSRLKFLENDWRDFAARINEISNSGLDGLIDQFHYSSFLLGAMGCEVEVTEDLRDIYDVYPVKPQTIQWELGDIDNHKKWIPYQWQMGNKVKLDKAHANFFWVPADPDIGDPRGTLQMTPVLQAIDFQMQILQDLQAVLHHQGYPKNDISIALDRLMAKCPQYIKNNPAELEKWIMKEWDNINNLMSKVRPDSDYIHFDDISINMNQGANAARSLDVRAVSELVDQQVMSGAKQLSIFMNRNTGVTESWGTVQFRIFCSGIASCQRGSKRLVEEIARLWLRVKGIQAVPVFKHNVLDWNSEEQRMTVKLMEEKYHAIAVLMGWETNDEAAQQVVKAEKAVGEPTENARISLSSGGDGIDYDEHPRKHESGYLRKMQSKTEKD